MPERSAESLQRPHGIPPADAKFRHHRKGHDNHIHARSHLARTKQQEITTRADRRLHEQSAIAGGHVFLRLQHPRRLIDGEKQQREAGENRDPPLRSRDAEDEQSDDREGHPTKTKRPAERKDLAD